MPNAQGLALIKIIEEDLNFCAKPSDIKGCAKIAKDYFKSITSN